MYPITNMTVTLAWLRNVSKLSNNYTKQHGADEPYMMSLYEDEHENSTWTLAFIWT